MVNVIGEKIGYKPVDICVNDNGKNYAVGMDCSLLMKDTDWSPQVGIEKMIQDLFEKRKGYEK